MSAAERTLVATERDIHDEWIRVGREHGLPILLRHLVSDSARPRERGAVLLLHGGNTSSETFLVPDGGLAAYLSREGWDVWLLDWRGSPLVLPKILKGGPLGGSARAERRWFNMDRVAEDDFPGAIAAVRARIGDGVPLSVVGHCLGGGGLCMALSRGHLATHRVQAFVMTTMGLFYEVPWDGWMKVEDFILERVLDGEPEARHVDPHDDASWPAELRRAYQHWPSPWLPHGGASEDRMLRRLAFMFGVPYWPGELHESLRGPILNRLFGPMALGLFLHTGQLVRRGFAAPFDAPDVLDRPRLLRGHVSDGDGNVRSDLNPAPFLSEKITLITGSENRLWHRDSIDLMYEWLRNLDGRTRDARYRKHVVPGYCHQELFWGTRARDEVYPLIRDGLG